MREVTCPVYPCGRAIFVGSTPSLTETFMREHLRSHDAAQIVAGFEALTAQNTRQLAHIGAINGELNAARREADELRVTTDKLRDALETRTQQWARSTMEHKAEFARSGDLAKNNARLRTERDEARVQRDRECARADRMLGVLEAARAVVDLLRLLDELGLRGSVSGPSRSLVAAMGEYDATVEVADVRS